MLEAVERRVRYHHESLPGRHDDDVALARGAHRVVESLPVLKRGGRVVGATGHRTVISNGELAGGHRSQRPQESASIRIVATLQNQNQNVISATRGRARPR